MDFLPRPHLPVFEVFKDVDLTGPFWSILKPTVPVAVIREPVLPEAGFKYFIPGFGPRDFVFEFGH